MKSFNWPALRQITLRAVINEVRKSHLYNFCITIKIFSSFIHRLFASVALTPICLSSHNVAISVDGRASRNCWSGTELRTSQSPPQPWQACGKLNLSVYDRSKLCGIRVWTIEYLLDTVRVEGRLWDRWAMNSGEKEAKHMLEPSTWINGLLSDKIFDRKGSKTFRVPGECLLGH